jgi:hypothetical protein
MCLSLVASALCLARPASARTSRVAVLPFKGPGGDRVRAAVVSRLANECEVVSMTEIRRAAATVPRPITPFALWQAVSRRLGLSAVIKGQVTAGRNWQARLVVNRAVTGLAVGSVVISDRGPKYLIREVLRTAPVQLLALVRRTEPDGPTPAVARRNDPGRSLVAGSAPKGRIGSAARARRMRPSTELVEGSTAAGSDDSGWSETSGRSSADPGSAPAAMFEASAGPRAIFRSLTYADNVSAVPGYRLPGTPGLAAEAAFYPAAHMTTADWGRHIGLTGAVEASMGASTQAAGGAIPTRHLAFRLGVRGVVPAPTGALDASLLLGADYGEQHFALAVPEGTVSPEAHYGFFRPSIAARIGLGRFSFLASVAYLHILDVAGLNAPGLFPNATIRGGDAGISAGYTIDSNLQAQLGADYRRYVYDMNARQEDTLLVGGALDEYIGLSAMLTYRFR